MQQNISKLNGEGNFDEALKEAQHLEKVNNK